MALIFQEIQGSKLRGSYGRLSGLTTKKTMGDVNKTNLQKIGIKVL